MANHNSASLVALRIKKIIYKSWLTVRRCKGDIKVTNWTFKGCVSNE